MAIEIKSYEGADWGDNGVCKDLDREIFYPVDGAGVTKARAVCRECPVKTPCLEYALTKNDNHGVWGGTSERQRRKMLRAIRVAKSAANAAVEVGQLASSLPEPEVDLVAIVPTEQTEVSEASAWQMHKDPKPVYGSNNSPVFMITSTSNNLGY